MLDELTDKRSFDRYLWKNDSWLWE
jgi:hypothetical protein